jgi:hypothetical protein
MLCGKPCFVGLNAKSVLCDGKCKRDRKLEKMREYDQQRTRPPEPESRINFMKNFNDSFPKKLDIPLTLIPQLSIRAKENKKVFKKAAEQFTGKVYNYEIL